MNILGISAFYHDSAAALVRDGKIIAAAQEERFTRKKHDAGFPAQAVEYCLKEGGITIDEVAVVAFYDKPFTKFERILETYLTFAPKGFGSFIRSIPLWLKDKLWMKVLLSQKLNYSGKFIFPEHHQSHAASAFYPSPFEEAAFLTLDGVGEWATSSYGVGSGSHIKIHSELHFPHSLGLLYSAFTYYTGFKVNSGEYKVMGLAPYGRPVYKELIYKHLIDVKEDGSFRLNMKYFNYCTGLTMTSRAFDDLFGGPPRKPESKITQREMDLARSVQDVTEEVVLKIGAHIHKSTGQKNLCLAGGVALNCVANGRLLREGPFGSLWIQPAAGDAGGALGAALFTWHQVQGNAKVLPEKLDLQRGSYLGPSYSEADIAEFLEEEGAVYTKLDPVDVAGKTADLIAEGNVIGWFQGRMEFGPRALGGRSILGNPRDPKMQETMNLKIKFRESFRPFAPSVLRDEVDHYFEMDFDSPYMLLVAPVVPGIRKKMTEAEDALFGIEKLNISRSEIPAVTHVDYSARVQTVHRETNSLYWELLKTYRDRHGCPVLINTSFNVRGEPIVCRPREAYLCLMRTQMDYLLIENFLIAKKDQKPLTDDTDWQKEFDLD